MKKKTEKTTKSQQRLWIGVGVIAVVAIALVVGLGALSIQPTETGTATVFMFTRDGTQINASETVSVYRCDYTNVTADEFDEFVSTFSNYEAVEINSSIISGLTLKLEIKENEIYMVKVHGSVYFNEWFQVFPGENRFVISEKPNAAGLSLSLTLMNSTHMQGLSYLTLYTVGDDMQSNKNCSVPQSLLDFENNELYLLYLKLDKTTNYTTLAFNLTGSKTYLFEGDLYVALPGINYMSEFYCTFDLAEMGTPTLSLVYATAGFATVTEIVDISQY